MEEILKLVMEIVASVVGLLVAWAAAELARKYRIELSDTQLTQIRGFAERGIFLAEQKSAEHCKLTGKLLTGEEKLRIASKYVIGKIPGVSQDEVSEIVNETLATLRAAGRMCLEKIHDAVNAKDN